MIMSPLIAFLIVFVLLLIALIKLKVTPSVGLFAAAIIFGLMVGMPAADIPSKLPAAVATMPSAQNATAVPKAKTSESLSDCDVPFCSTPPT